MRKSIILFFILALIMGCAASFKEKRSLSKPFVSLAMGKIERGDTQGALVELRRALEANTSDPEVFYAFSLAYWKSENYEKALENVDKAIRHADNLILDHPGLKSEAYNLKGSLLVLKGKKEDAISAFKNAVKDELYSTPEYTYFNLASLYLDMDRHEDAQKAAQQALDRNQHYAPAWNISGQILFKQGDENQAIDAFNHAIFEFNGYVEAYWNLARIHTKRGNKKEALRLLQEVVKLDPNGAYGTKAQESIDDLQ